MLRDVSIEDAWAIPLPGGGEHRTVADLRSAVLAARAAGPGVAQPLLWVRQRIGAWLDRDRPRPDWLAESISARLEPTDRARSLVEPRTPDGSFRLVYRFEREQLGELRNAAVHAFAALSIERTSEGYRAYLGVFGMPAHRLTGLYMALIAPFRRRIVYPAIARSLQRAWIERYAEAPSSAA